jgi:hypothetical protein
VSRSPIGSGHNVIRCNTRHQLQEVAVHTYDAQVTLGAARPLPDEAALDGVDDFLSTCCAGTDPWPHEPCAVDYQVTDGTHRC